MLAATAVQPTTGQPGHPPLSWTSVLPYDGTLIDSLLGEHTRLRRSLESAEVAAYAGDVGAVVHLCADIRTGLRAVARVEALRVFPFVRRCGPEDEVFPAALNGLRAELAALSRRLMRSLDLIESADRDPVAGAGLMDELGVLSRTLLELVLAKGRLLYPLYRPDAIQFPPQD
jgi:hypothetical protein